MNRFLAALLFLCLMLSACGGGGSDGSGTGTLSLAMTDSGTTGVDQVWITVESIEVHSSGSGWQTLAPANVTFPLTVDLLTLQNGASQTLGLNSLPAGHYTQIRLSLADDPAPGSTVPFGNCVHVTGEAANTFHELDVPSGGTSGLKLTHQFTITDGGTYELLLDFDAGQSVHQTGAGQWKMRPVIRTIVATLTGSVSGSTEPGAVVMAQEADPDLCGGIRIAGTTTADGDGNFALGFLDPGTYNLVVAMDGFALAAESGVTVTAGVESDNHLLPLVAGDAFFAVSGTVDNLPADTANPTVKAVTTVGAIEVIADHSGIATDGHYSLLVPPGAYDLYLCAQGEETPAPTAVTVIAADVEQNLSF